jgi:hypothetical protein
MRSCIAETAETLVALAVATVLRGAVIKSGFAR